MIIVRTPFRVSFFGGGTDYPAWYQEHGGAVLATTIDKYCWITLRRLPPFFEHRGRLAYRNVELFTHISEIKHPVVSAALSFLGDAGNIEMHHDGDLPARAGMGSSSAFAVGFLHAMHALRGKMVSKEELAEQAIHLEQVLIGESVGSQDQPLSAHGGFNRIEFLHDGKREVHPVILNAERVEELQSHLMLIFTGFSRTASDIAELQIKTVHERERELSAMRRMVDRGLDVLTGGFAIELFGELLHEYWHLKRSLTDQISTETIDRIYSDARDAGALGGKIIGAGGGGFMLLFVRPKDQESVRTMLGQYLHVPFRFENNGSQIVHYEP